MSLNPQTHRSALIPDMAMMCLGQFVFELLTVPYQSQQQQMAWRHPVNSRVGLRPARQFLGKDDESMTLSGVLYPEITGGKLSLEALRMMADSGNAYVLVEGDGTLKGVFIIESMETTRTVFFEDGTPRKIEFSLALKRVDDDAVYQGSEVRDQESTPTLKTTVRF